MHPLEIGCKKSLESNNAKARPNLHGSNEIRAALNGKEGPQILRDLGRKVAAATGGQVILFFKVRRLVTIRSLSRGGHD